MGIRSKLVLCLLAVMLPVAAVGVFASHLFDNQLEERSIYALANTQRLESERIDQVLSQYARRVQALASEPALLNVLAQTAFEATSNSVPGTSPEQPDRPEGSATLQQSVALDAVESEARVASYFEAIEPSPEPIAIILQRMAATLRSAIVELRILDQHGKIAGQTEGFSWKPADKQLIDRARNLGEIQFGNAFVNPAGQQHLGIVSPVINHSGTVVGVLIAEAELSPVIEMIGKYETMGRTIEAHIAQPTIDGDAQFITPLRFERSAAFSKVVDASSATPINLALDSPDTQVIRASDYRGVDSYFALKTIAGVGWGLVVKIDVAEAHAPVKELQALAAIGDTCINRFYRTDLCIPACSHCRSS